MTKESRNLFAASQEALKSEQTFRHGAVITGRGGKILAAGYNKGNRTKVLNYVFTCVHAEMDAISKLVNRVLIPKYGNDFRKHTNKYTIWVVRLQKGYELKYTNSRPCYYCTKIMQDYGFSKVCYTIDDNTIKKQKVNTLIPEHKSYCQVKSDNVNTNIRFKLF